jgi:hypothetical protein
MVIPSVFQLQLPLSGEKGENYMEKTFITEVKNVGPQIKANSWEEAELKAQELGVTLVGELEV